MKQTKLITILGAIFALGFNAVNASLNVTSTTTYLDKYVNRGVFLADEVIQSSLTVEYNKAYVAINSFWGTQAKNVFDHEWNASLGVIVRDVLFEGVNIDAGLTGYFFPNGEISETKEGYIGISLPVVWFDVSAYAYNDFDTDVTTGIVSASNTIMILESLGWTNGVSVGFTDKDSQVKYGWLGASSKLQLALGENFSVFGAGSYTWSDDADLFDISGVAWSGGVSLSF